MSQTDVKAEVTRLMAFVDNGRASLQRTGENYFARLRTASVSPSVGPFNNGASSFAFPNTPNAREKLNGILAMLKARRDAEDAQPPVLAMALDTPQKAHGLPLVIETTTRGLT